MEDIGRRSAFAIGLAAAATSALVLPTAAAARTYAPNEGKELAPGVRLVELGKWDSTIAAYKKIEMNDLVFQPGSTFPETAMDSDMICHVYRGKLLVKKGGKQFTVKDGDVYSCTKGETEGVTNSGTEVAIMRFIMLTA